MNRPDPFLSSRPLAFRSRPEGRRSRRAWFALAAGALLASSPLPAADLVVQGANSPYAYTAGTASYSNIYVGQTANGTLTQSGGTLTQSGDNTGCFLGYNAGVTGTYNLSNGTLNTFFTIVGNSGTGVFNQTGGTGAYLNMNIGLNAGSVGTYNQSAGTVTSTTTSGPGGIELGYNAGSLGTYNLSGTGQVNAADGLIVGDRGTGVFNQTGGTLASANYYILLGSVAGSNGTYTLGGGVFQSGGVQGGSGTSAFHFAGGTLQAAVNDSAFFQSLTTADVRGNGGAIIDTQGFAVTVAQSLVHDTSTNAPATDGGLTKQGTGTLTLTGTNTYTGTTNVSAGTLTLGTGGSVTGSTVNVSPGATFTVAGGSVNTGGGTTTFNVGSTTGAATATANLSSGSLATSFFNVGDANGGTGVFNQTGGAATYFNLEVGQVAGSVGTYNQSASTVTITSQGAMSLGVAAGAQGIYNLSGTGQVNAVASGLNVGLNGTGTFDQTGGTLMAGNSGVLLGRNSGSGGTYTLGGGVLQAGGVQGGSGTSAFHFAGGTLQATGTFSLVQGLTTADVQAGGAIINTNGFSVPIPQSLVHDTSTNAPATDGGLTKLGTGALTLTGTNTYTGPTTVSAGTLLADNTAGSATGTGAVTVASGGTLGGTGTVAGAVTVQSGGRLDAGNAGAVGMLSLGSGLSLPNGATLGVQLGGTAPGTGYDQIRVAGTLTLGGTLSVTESNGFKLTLGQTFVILDDTGLSLVTTTFANAPGGLYTDAAGNTFRVNYAATADADLVPNDVTLTVVPEPGTYALLAVGVAGLGLVTLRQRRAVRLG